MILFLLKELFIQPQGVTSLKMNPKFLSQALDLSSKPYFFTYWTLTFQVFFFWPCHACMWHLRSWLRIKLMSPTVKVSRLNHWTVRKSLECNIPFSCYWPSPLFLQILSVIHPPHCLVWIRVTSSVSFSNQQFCWFSLQDVSLHPLFCSSSICSASSSVLL